jgi:hypothetical protein
MDNNYRTHLAGSPYIAEGLWDRIKALGASKIQQYKSVTGKGIKTVDDTKVDSLWNSLLTNVGDLAQDFNQHVAPSTRKLKDLTSSEKETIKLFERLEREIRTSLKPQFSKAAVKSLLTPRRYGTPGSTPIEPFKYTQTGPKQVDEQGLKGFLRHPSLVKALASGDTKKIIAAYKDRLEQLFTQFVQDTKKTTNFSNQEIKTKLLGDPNKSKILQNVLEPLTGGALVRLTAPPPSITPPVTVPTTIPSAGPIVKGTPTSTEDNENLEFVKQVITKTIESFVNAVKKDTKRSGLYFTADKLPTEWDDPEWEAEKKKHHAMPDDYFDDPLSEPPEKTMSDTVTESDEDDEKKEKERIKDLPEPPENEFLHRFHYKYRKFRTFDIPIGNFEVNLGGIPRKVDVYLRTRHHSADKKHAHYNEIYISLYSHAKKENIIIPIFRFFDHHVDSRSPEGKKFSLSSIITKEVPILEQALKTLPNLNVLTDQFQRAVVATIDRKRMEFKGKKKPNIDDAIKAMQTLGFNKEDSEKYVYMAVEMLGKDANSGDLVTKATKLAGTPPKSATPLTGTPTKPTAPPTTPLTGTPTKPTAPPTTPLTGTPTKPTAPLTSTPPAASNTAAAVGESGVSYAKGSYWSIEALEAEVKKRLPSATVKTVWHPTADDTLHFNEKRPPASAGEYFLVEVGNDSFVLPKVNDDGKWAYTKGFRIEGADNVLPSSVSGIKPIKVKRNGLRYDPMDHGKLSSNPISAEPPASVPLSGTPSGGVPPKKPVTKSSVDSEVAEAFLSYAKSGGPEWGDYFLKNRLEETVSSFSSIHEVWSSSSTFGDFWRTKVPETSPQRCFLIVAGNNYYIVPKADNADRFSTFKGYNATGGVSPKNIRIFHPAKVYQDDGMWKLQEKGFMSTGELPPEEEPSKPTTPPKVSIDDPAFEDFKNNFNEVVKQYSKALSSGNKELTAQLRQDFRGKFGDEAMPADLPEKVWQQNMSKGNRWDSSKASFVASSSITKSPKTKKEEPPEKSEEEPSHAEKVIKNVNTALSAGGLPPLDTLGQVNYFISLKGAHNKKLKDPGISDEEKRKLLMGLINKAKKKHPTSIKEFKNSIINPFVFSNLIN